MKSNEITSDYWDEEIIPEKRLLTLNLREVFNYWDLVILFVRRDFVANYKQTILGPGWFIIQPLLSTITFTVIFGKVANIATNGVPPLLFYLGGLTMWNYFSTNLLGCSNTFTTNQGIFGKVYFPRLVVPISTVISNLVKLSVQFILFLVVWLYYWLYTGEVEPNLHILFLPLYIGIGAISSLGMGIIISSLTTKYRDFNFLLGFGVQLLMYASPIIYPFSVVPEQYRWILLLNPMSSVIESFKYSFTGSGMFLGTGLIYSSIFCVIVLFVGIIIFNRTERSFMDTV